MKNNDQKKEKLDLREFIKRYESQALAIDIKRLHPKAYSVYLKRKSRLETAEFDSEKTEVLNEIKGGVTGFKEHILNAIINEHYRARYNGIPSYIEQLRFYLMYKELYSGRGDKQLESEEKKENLHPHIFKNNAFEIWQYMFDSFDITESSLTDTRFMYEAMKKDGFIFSTIGEKDLRDWIGETYSLVMNKTKYTNPKWDSNKKRMAVYNAAKEK